MSARFWLTATRLRTLPLATAAVLCGGLLAAQAQQLKPQVWLLCWLTALLLQIFSNLANDYGDACHGADSALRQGPARMVARGLISPPAMRIGLALTAAAIVVCGLLLLLVALPLLQTASAVAWLLWLLLGLSALAAAFCYTAGRRPYGYAGWGDAAVWLFFGLLGVLGTAYLQSGRIEAQHGLSAAALGWWCVMVLNLNNLRDICADRAAGKRTLPVRFGSRCGRVYHIALLLAAATAWWLWLPAVFAADAAAALRLLLVLLCVWHGWQFQRARDAAALDRLLPRWSLALLLWVSALWLAV